MLPRATAVSHLDMPSFRGRCHCCNRAITSESDRRPVASYVMLPEYVNEESDPSSVWLHKICASKISKLENDRRRERGKRGVEPPAPRNGGRAVPERIPEIARLSDGTAPMLPSSSQRTVSHAFRARPHVSDHVRTPLTCDAPRHRRAPTSTTRGKCGRRSGMTLMQLTAPDPRLMHVIAALMHAMRRGTSVPKQQSAQQQSHKCMRRSPTPRTRNCNGSERPESLLRWSVPPPPAPPPPVRPQLPCRQPPRPLHP